jgi:hypothetical protein
VALTLLGATLEASSLGEYLALTVLEVQSDRRKDTYTHRLIGGNGKALKF